MPHNTAATTSPLAFLKGRLDQLKSEDLYRALRPLEGPQGPWVALRGRRVLNMCSNNYLGLAAHPEVVRAGIRSLEEWGCGCGASRLISGSTVLHEQLENRLARFKGTESALAYTSGYTANLGIISALVGKGDIIFSDELNHASLIDGCRLSQAKVVVFRHADPNDLEHALAAAPGTARRLIVTDAVFSMDGDIAPLAEYVSLAEEHGCLLMVDEAHATGTLGPGGRGLAAALGLEQRIPVLMGTLSKALGSFGGFAAGTGELREFLINTSRSFIFATALPPASAACALAAIDQLERHPDLPAKLQRNARRLRSRLGALGFNTLNSTTQIIPVLIGGPTGTVRMSELLLERGVMASPIRPPTVPQGSSRIRLAVMATHTEEDIEFTVGAFEEAGRLLGAI